MKLRRATRPGRPVLETRLPSSRFVTAAMVAYAVVVIELLGIASAPWRFMDTPPLLAAAKVMLGGALVRGAGILIGSA